MAPLETAAATSEAARKYGVLDMPDLEYTPELAKETAHAYDRISSVVPPVEWPAFAPYVKAINELKKERNAVILAHNYMTPEIFHCIADFVGDSLQLAVEASRTDAEIIVQCGVHFMAETAKLLSPEKTVLIPDMKAGCSLAAVDHRCRCARPARSLSGCAGRDLCQLLGRSEGRVRCVLHVVQRGQDRGVTQQPARHLHSRTSSWPNMSPSRPMWKSSPGKAIARCTSGSPLKTCARRAKLKPGLRIIAHPECPPDVLAEADFTGSTSGMINWVKDNKPGKVMMVTECSMSDNVAVETPEVEFIRPCNLCPHMKRITLPKILDSLVYMKEEIVIDPEVAARARKPRLSGWSSSASSASCAPSHSMREPKIVASGSPISAFPFSARRGDCVVIIGAGLAGLFTALKLAPRPVVVISPTPLGEGASSGWAQGGIAAAVSEGDTPEAHARDTIRAGAGIVDECMAHLLASDAAERIEDLLRLGVPFDKDLEGKLQLSREAAHGARRIARVKGDLAGKAIMAAVTDAVRKTPSIQVLEGMSAHALATSRRTCLRRPPMALLDIGIRPGDHVAGEAVVLASGGAGQLYDVTTNPASATGEGVAMAALAGAVIADAEFVQFHPTALNIGRDPRRLATEALRGEGATLINSRGERYMTGVHEDAELAPARCGRARNLPRGPVRTRRLHRLPRGDRIRGSPTPFPGSLRHAGVRTSIL